MCYNEIKYIKELKLHALWNVSYLPSDTITDMCLGLFAGGTNCDTLTAVAALNDVASVNIAGGEGVGGVGGGVGGRGR